MTNELTQETGSVLLLHSTERKDDSHTLSTASALVSVLTGVIFDLFHLCKWLFFLIRLQGSTQHTLLE